MTAEIAKLRARLKNVNRNTTEYRMTVLEAKTLLSEIDRLEKNIEVEKNKLQPKEENYEITRIMDGGTF